MVKIVYEIGINANGSIDTAKKMIDVACAAGCDYVKFQKRCIDLVYTKEELRALRKSPWGDTNEDQKRGLEFTLTDYAEIDLYCKKKGIPWFVSPWDKVSIADMNRFDIPFLKVPSALITDMDYLQAIKETRKPVVLSTGMSTFIQIEEAVSFLGTQIEYILHCTSTYPSKPKEQDLLVIPWLKQTYPNYKIGMSNHSPGLTFMIGAMALQVDIIEFHGCLDRSDYGSDQSASIEPEGVFRLVKHLRAMEEALGDGVKKVHDSEYPVMLKLRK
jgi:N-acetylneuraminate synthase